MVVRRRSRLRAVRVCMVVQVADPPAMLSTMLKRVMMC